MKNKKILIVSTTAMSVNAFLINLLEKLCSEFQVTLICSDEDSNLKLKLPSKISFIPITIFRKVNIFGDLNSFLNIFSIIKNERFDLIFSITPKAGLLSQMAAFLCGINFRIHMFTGQIWVTKKNIARLFYKIIDRLIAGCCTHVLADSFSQRLFLVEEKIVSSKKIKVIGPGSISGVDILRFREDKLVRQEIRDQFDLRENDILGIFIGRLTIDKGVLDLVRAFSNISNSLINLKLLFIGPDEEGIREKILDICPSNPNLFILDATNVPEKFMAAADFICLPSYREGFGTVIIEAAACALPAVASNIYGLSDAVIDGVTGLLHSPHNISEISDLLFKFSTDHELRKRMGIDAKNRANELFASEKIIDAQLDYFRHFLN